jgi:excisionase family DNA binding protein
MIDLNTLPGSALLTPKQAAEVLNVPEGTLNMWRTRGGADLAYIKVGKGVRYRVAAIQEFLEVNTKGAAA